MKRLLAALALLAAACTPTPSTPDAYRPRLKIDDNYVYVDRLNEVPLTDGTIEVGVSGGSRQPVDQTLRYRVRWYDAKDLPIDTVVSDWHTLRLLGNGTFEFKAVAPGPRARRYVVEFDTQP